MIWDPARYLLFEDLRTRPAAELLARVPHSFPSSVVDLGCGPGNSAKLLRERWPEAHLVGVDSSEEMLSAARVDYPKISFEAGDIAAWEPEGPVDVIFANAVLQWIPDHIGLLPRLMSFVAAGGSLALQVPNNYDQPAHVEAHRIVRRLFPDLGGILPDRRVFDPLDHYEALAGPGVMVDVWETAYVHPLDGEDPVPEWTAGTFLRPLLDHLEDDPERAGTFMALYRESMREAYPRRADGATLLLCPRLFAVATKIS